MSSFTVSQSRAGYRPGLVGKGLLREKLWTLHQRTEENSRLLFFYPLHHRQQRTLSPRRPWLDQACSGPRRVTYNELEGWFVRCVQRRWNFLPKENSNFCCRIFRERDLFSSPMTRLSKHMKTPPPVNQTSWKMLLSNCLFNFRLFRQSSGFAG